MGAWGRKPWENDDAADFFAGLFPPDFHDKIMAALRSEWEEEVRAAAWVVTQLAHSGYVWPPNPEAMIEACRLAADKLEELATESEQGDELWDWDELRREAAELRTRRHRPLGQ
jgi:hypothetical protein